ncbi:carboxylate--amine ligase [Adlercreutzia sp. ZJ154]|uniref:carboxylate--amine ligase n=1 Tax=Adlercreutzia sp. ZJ154 TaxID=2709790 RepID=UPI0013EC617B|nr:carboxylate--amine ligase [Adlercreutzia sp. ZJ154]
MHSDEVFFQPVILGADRGAYSLARAFHEAYGIKSIGISQQHSRMCDSSSTMEMRMIPGMDYEEVFLSKLSDIADERPDKQLILFGCGDWYVDLITRNRAELEKHFIIPYVSEQLRDSLVLKDRFFHICDELGVPVPETVVYDVAQGSLEEIASLPFEFPIYVKPASSADYHYVDFPGKRKVCFVHSREELEELISNMRDAGYVGKLVLQKPVLGDDSHMRILTTYSDRNGKVRMASFGQVLLEDKRPLALGNPVAIISRSNDSVVADAVRLLEHVGYTGFANFDIKVDERDGQYRFFELNSRLGRSNYYVTMGGQNVAKWVVEDLIENKQFSDDIQKQVDGRLYSAVPKKTIMSCLSDPNLKAEVESIYSQGNVFDPMAYSGEASFMRRVVYPRVHMRNYGKVMDEVIASDRRKAAEGAPVSISYSTESVAK